MFRIIKVDTSGQSPSPVARRFGPSMPRGFPWGGGRSWLGLLHEPISVEADDGDECPGGLPDFFQTIGLHIVSVRLARLLEALGAEVELWPASVTHQGKLNTEGFLVANPLNQLSALDIEQSDVKLDEAGLALSAGRVVLDEEKFADSHWVKVHELQQVAVSPAFQAALRNSGFTGIQFVDPLAFRL